MKCSLKQLGDAIDFFKYQMGVSAEQSEVEIIAREEDFEAGKVQAVLTMIVTYQKAPGQYDRWKAQKSIKHTLEIFPDSDNRNPHLTTEESFELPDKA